MLKAYKVQLDPNNIQITKMKMNCGAARWAFNFALSKKKEAFDKKEKTPNNIELHRELNKLKGTEELSWGYAEGISKCSFQEALRDCDKAFDNFFRRCKQKTKGKKGFPKFKSKRNDKQSFRLTGRIHVLDGYIQLPRLGKIRLFEKDYLPKDTKILSATVSRRADKWFVSLQVDEEIDGKTEVTNDSVAGVDLGIKTLATCSDGVIYENPKALRTNLKRLKRKSRQLSRKQKGSKNREKAKQKLAKLHYKISNIRKDALHKITSQIVNENQVIVLEDLKVSSMMKNHKLAQSISDVGFYEFRRQIEYKAKWYGKEVVFVNTFYPSSKLCSVCGWKNENLTLTDRVFECKVCNSKIDRDMNAAINLKQFYTGSSPEIYACEDGSSEKEISLSPSAKQESNRKSSFRFL
ncbi:MAG TPA: RNA-guided endonuclease TnpB family protein [Leptospiraceae bacterium]|nr:RNA-guided endonuclease TnpB family protein [Leptospiraceae bacterium]